MDLMFLAPIKVGLVDYEGDSDEEEEEEGSKEEAQGTTSEDDEAPSMKRPRLSN